MFLEVSDIEAEPIWTDSHQHGFIHFFQFQKLAKSGESNGPDEKHGFVEACIRYEDNIF